MCGFGQFIPDVSSPESCQGNNERKCATNLKTASNWFLPTPTSVYICQKLHDVFRQSFAKVDSSELSPKALIITSKSVAFTDAFCLQQRPNNPIAMPIIGVVYCSTLDGSE